MKDKELRKLIGSRAKQRRQELGLKQPYVAEKMGVTASTIQRYEAGTIDNTKKLVLDGLSEALHVSVEWLKGEIAAHQQGPIIFFCHAPLMGTLRTYTKKINTPQTTAQPADQLKEILSHCPPGSLWVSGHTHTPPKNDSFADDSVNRFNENLVNIHNPCIDKKHVYTNSLYLYDDKVVVRTYDHRDNEWVTKLDRTYKN